MKIKIPYLILAFFAFIILIYFIGYREGHRKGDRALQTSDSLFHANESHYITTIEGMRYTIAEKTQEIVSLREARKQDALLKESMERLDIRRVNEITRLRLTIDTLLTIKGDSNVIYVDTCLEKPRPAMLLPFSLNKDDKWLSLRDSVDIKGARFLSLQMDIPLQIIGSVEKKTNRYKIDVLTPNPYVRFSDIDSKKLDVPKVKKWGIGFFVGYGVSREGLSPIVGFGGSRNIIRF